MLHSGWGFIHKFHSRCPSLVGDPEDHKLNAKISKGRVGLNPPSTRLVITLWNRKIHPRRATRLSASINLSNINYKLYNLEVGINGGVSVRENSNSVLKENRSDKLLRAVGKIKTLA